MSFPDERFFHEWAQCPEYQEIATDRKSGSNRVALLAKGF
jgi:uncharacterized protein (DUF1330 family)